jgi:hypothetical protein
MSAGPMLPHDRDAALAAWRSLTPEMRAELGAQLARIGKAVREAGTAMTAGLASLNKAATEYRRMVDRIERERLAAGEGL